MDSGRSSPVNLSRSGSLRVTSNSFNRTSLVRRNQSMSAKQIRFYRNGDRFFHGLKLAVSSERYKEFDSLLAELSEKLNLSSGAVRFIFNAEDSSMITDITQLQYGVPYVCSSTNSFRTIEGGYGKNLNSWSIIPKPKNIYKPTVLGNIENYHIINNLRNENGREFIKPKLVTVIRNGKPPQKKVTLLLNSKTAISLDQVLDQLSAKGSLGKVDKLFTVDGRMVKVLRDLFDDDTVFIAMSTNEKFPEDGIELDPNSYRITPYRELKRPSNMSVRRSNSLRHSMSHYKNDENLSISRLAKNMRPKNMMGNLKGNMSKVPRPRSGIVKHVDQTEELYPTSVFETDSSESAKAKRKNKNRVKSLFTMDTYYNTVWLSDFESVKSCGSRSGYSSLNHSRASFPDNNSLTPVHDDFMTKPLRSSSVVSSRSQSKTRIHRTLSLPESDLANINAEDLQERFSRLQVEQENRELKMLVRQLQEALEKLEAKVLRDLSSNNDSHHQSPSKVCANCSSISSNNNRNNTVPSIASPLQSPDSLEENILPEDSEKGFKVKDKNESGYSTFNNESLNDDHSSKQGSLKDYRYMEYSDTVSYTSTSEDENKFYESRLSRKRKHHYDDSGCCLMQ